MDHEEKSMAVSVLSGKYRKLPSNGVTDVVAHSLPGKYNGCKSVVTLH